MIEYNCNKHYKQKFGEKLKERFFNTYKFSNHDNNKFFYFCEKVFILMNIWMIGNNSMKHYYLKKSLKLYSHLNYSHLNSEDVTDADYTHAQRVCKDLEIKKTGEYHELYVQSDTLLLANVFESFRNMRLEMYELDPARFLSTPGLEWQTALKRTKVKLDLLTDIDMLLMVEKGIRGGIWVLVWLCKTKIWWKSKILLYGYRRFHCIHKQMIFRKILQKTWKLDLILQIMN